MNVDWFTFTAQIINFLVLAGLLRWFLYGPIVRAMQQREAKIAGRLDEAEQKCMEADKKALQYEKKTQEIEEQREERLKDAREEAHQYRERSKKESSEEVARMRDDWLDALDREREDILDEFRQEVGRLAEAAARHTISELAGDDLEERIFRNFVSRMQHLDEHQRAEISTHLENEEADISVRSAFDVSEQWRNRLREVIRESFGQDSDVSFEKSTDLICGIEVDVGGYSFGWNVNEQLRQLRLDFAERLRTRK